MYAFLERDANTLARVFEGNVVSEQLVLFETDEFDHAFITGRNCSDS